ncbi:MAG TPA: FAD-binding oxidoreductase [Micromonosporaceae bacterium]|nr:FAD-binding oxidoreductase [Micromonosporaceae bacterium]
MSAASGRAPDVVVVGAGIIGAACAYFAARAGLDVLVLDRGPVAGGTSGAGEGNILISDKLPGPELALALLSATLWRRLGDEIGAARIELEAKGGLVVASTGAALAGLAALAGQQRAHGVRALAVPAQELPGYEPALAGGLAGGAFYPDDLQVQPMLATAHLLRAARAAGARVRTGVAVTGVLRGGRDGRVRGVRTVDGEVGAGAVVNAAGTWAGEVAGLAGVALPVAPRRGFVLVTEALPAGTIRHKVYAAEYTATIASDRAGLESSAVVEGTRAGTVLVGASRERVGFDRGGALPVLRRLATQAVALFPVLAGVRVIRYYTGFRPYCPDHLPVVGADPRVPGLVHACGHEGAGIGLAPGTGALVAAALTGAPPPLDPAPYRVERFA